MAFIDNYLLLCIVTALVIGCGNKGTKEDNGEQGKTAKH